MLKRALVLAAQTFGWIGTACFMIIDVYSIPRHFTELSWLTMTLVVVVPASIAGAIVFLLSILEEVTGNSSKRGGKSSNS